MACGFILFFTLVGWGWGWGWVGKQREVNDKEEKMSVRCLWLKETEERLQLHSSVFSPLYIHIGKEKYICGEERRVLIRCT